jgi:hypothetical protein
MSIFTAASLASEYLEPRSVNSCPANLQESVVPISNDYEKAAIRLGAPKELS